GPRWLAPAPADSVSARRWPGHAASRMPSPNWPRSRHARPASAHRAGRDTRPGARGRLSRTSAARPGPARRPAPSPCRSLGVLGVERRAQPVPARLQVLDHHLGVAEDGHEVRVARPARDDVPVHVLGDAGSRGGSQVHPQVVALRAVGLPDEAHRDPQHLRELLMLLARKGDEVRVVAARHDHQVAVVVRVPVEDGERMRSAAEDEVLAIVFAARQIAEDASALRPSLRDQLPPPRRPELLHHLTRFGARNISPPWGTADRTPSLAPWKAPRIRSRRERSCSRVGYCTFRPPLWPARPQAAAMASSRPPSSSTSFNSFARLPV